MLKRTALALVVLMAPALVLAHVYLRGTEPADGTVLESPPARVKMEFVGSLEPAFSRVEVFAPDGEKVSGKTRFFEGDSIMEASLKEGLGPGVYEARWICVSLDGHKQTGLFKFEIK
ncbi:MAG: hypothetical protein Kow0025_14550 [Thermodesulfovibrionales bacterium]